MDVRGGRQRRRRHPLRAEPTRQLRLLDLQSFDTRLDQIAHAKARLPQQQAVARLEEELATLDVQLVNARTSLSDVQRQVDRAEADVQLVRDRAERDRTRLASGSGTAKDLQAIQHELESLARRQSELEDLELEVMERAESLATHVAHLESSRAELAERLTVAKSARDWAVGELDGEARTALGRRTALVPEVGEDLLALYTRIRGGSGGGIGAAELRQRRCEGCHIELNQVDINHIVAAAPDEVLRCEECDRILVRTAESGLPAPRVGSQ